MTAVKIDRPQAAPLPRASVAGTIRSELTKLRSVSSTYWTLLILVVASIGFATVIGVTISFQWPHMSVPGKRNFDFTQTSLLALVILGQLAIAVFGALAITSEYSTGTIRTSLTVMPKRWLLYWAKAAAIALVTLAVAVPASFATFFMGQAMFARTHPGASLSQPGVLRAVIATALLIAVCGLFAYGLGAILRHTAGAITTAILVLFLLPQLTGVLPSSWQAALARWMPGGNAIMAISHTRGARPGHLFSAWGEFAVFGGYTLILLIAGGLLFARRDA